MYTLLRRFMRYVEIDTQSDPNSSENPSTAKQLNLAHLLVKELGELGLENISLSEQGHVMASLPSNVAWDVPNIGFIAHMDTAPDASGCHVRAQVIPDYDGKDVHLGNSGEVLSVERFPFLTELVGQTLITTDGTTLLGSDDKAGIAAIMTAIEQIQNRHIEHGTIQIAFTPDEEIGRGVKNFDVKRFNAQWAYTIDGGPVGELQYENFNAAGVKIHIKGNNVHPGSAKGVMVNALELAHKIHDLLPKAEKPESTSAREGFFHLCELQGCVEQATMHYIIRDFDRENFQRRKALLQQGIEMMQAQLPDSCTIELVMTDSYYNMLEKLSDQQHIIQLAKQAMLDIGVSPKIEPIRGGTDGAQLSYMGLPCPNIFTGGYNFHSKFELNTVESMQKAMEVIVRISQLLTEQSRTNK